MKIFYARVSTKEQNEARQIEMAEKCGAEKTFLDKASGRNTDRPNLKSMLGFIREGDTVIVESFSRIARSTKDLLSILDEIKGRGANFISLKENIDTSSPQGKFMLTVFAALTELEVDCIRERQMEGIAIAKSEGKYHGRKPMHIDEDKFKNMCKQWRDGKRTAVSIMREFNISATTFYKFVDQRGF